MILMDTWNCCTLLVLKDLCLPQIFELSRLSFLWMSSALVQPYVTWVDQIDCKTDQIAHQGGTSNNNNDCCKMRAPTWALGQLRTHLDRSLQDLGRTISCPAVSPDCHNFLTGQLTAHTYESEYAESEDSLIARVPQSGRITQQSTQRTFSNESRRCAWKEVCSLSTTAATITNSLSNTKTATPFSTTTELQSAEVPLQAATLDHDKARHR